MLMVRGLRVSYGRSAAKSKGGAILALRHVSLDVPPGAVVAVLGSNGAGKTTLLRAVSGVLGEHGGSVDEGSIEFEGRSLVGRSAAAIVSAGIVQSPEGRRIFERLTVAENLRIGGFSVRQAAVRTRARLLVYDLFPILYDRRGQRAGLLSGGQQQMLAIGRALMSSPRLLLLDEPSLGLAPQVIGQIGRVVKDINARGTAVVLVEQNAAMALSVATHAYVLTTGEVSLSGPAAELAANDAVRELYLGRDTEHAVDEELAHGTTRPALPRWAG
ncbi:MAG: ABC transporter ATP-binding protein [Actinobacteria bacterium 13_2_20CM_2_71_6]|nr:MAG: ABC transporter ATP-binding protein [Actinobacteria bacterium 13_2_20CM_2_71_6]